MEKILVIKHGALGDFVLAAGLMFSLKEKHPDAEFTLMTGSLYLSIARQMGIFTHYIIDNRGSYAHVGEMRRILRETVAGNFDRIYDLQASSRTRKRYFPVLRWMTRRSFVWVDYYGGNELHIEKKNHRGWGRMEKVPSEKLPNVTDLAFLHGEGKHFDELPEKFVLMIPGCSPNHPYKRWPVEYFRQLVQRLAGKGIHSVLIGTSAEEKEMGEIASASPLAVNMLNKTSLLDVPDIARRALATVGNDTGPSHMASLTGCPTIAMYDNRTKQGAMRGPRSVNLVSPDVIDKITVDQVWESLLSFEQEK